MTEPPHRRARNRNRGQVAVDHRFRNRDRGQVAVEYLGFVPILLLIALAGIQLGLIAFSAQQAGTAARAGARAASLDRSAQQGCQAAVSAALSGRTSCAEGRGGGTVTVTATVDIPSIIPLWDPMGSVSKIATMPLDH
ncbi:TadE/TadG family type IV pilus assembly protein [Streptomyces sp. SID10815]|uniref:TadE/TadG family type IV pilus assembly protein n=1 Tax=Streptomyces sp. SID10815 TaxID=2706027 RepID=UPI0013CB240E|nr:TadE/TadG family type IV pilus assembly protein [Streptomyces sp. SID10815]NEA48709.1 septum formation initiator [Streptomyces sp. SID10815]